MKNRIQIAGLVMSLCILTSVVKAADPAVDTVAVAIARGTAFLYAQQSADGSWETGPQADEKAVIPKTDIPLRPLYGGRTALTTYALLSAGEKPTNPNLAKAIVWLKAQNPPVGTYALGFRLLVWMHLPQTEEVKKIAKRDAGKLVSVLHQDGLAWYVPQGQYEKRENPHTDTSNGQITALGLWAATFSEVEVPKRAWQAIDKGWRTIQFDTGAWYYGEGKARWAEPHIGMTCAGLATLFITQDMLQTTAQEKGNIPDPNVEKARAYLAAHFDEIFRANFYSPRHHYALYALERCGVAGGYRYFGTHDWYKRGAEFLLKEQGKDGSWRDGIEESEENGVADTAMATLFLAYGRAPIIISKLEYQSLDTDGKKNVLRWHQRPRDVANVTRWISLNLERPLNWQIISLSSPLDELLESPVLYLSGDRAFTFTPEEMSRLRAFVNRGGLIVANADVASPAFVKSVRLMLSELFPIYESRTLPDDHPLLANAQFSASRWKSRPRIEGISNGVRELAIIIPNDDFARSWQTQAFRTKPDPFEAMANIVLYAVDKTNLSPRILKFAEAVEVKRDANSMPVARLKYTGNWNPEPAAWDIFKSSAGAPAVDVVDVDLTSPVDARFKFAHLTGTGAFKLTEAELSNIKGFLTNGGTILIEPAGGSGEFADAAEKMLLDLKIDNLQPKGLAADAEILKKPHEVSLTNVRPWFLKTRGVSPASIRTFSVGDRVAIYFSDTDLSAGLGGLKHDGIAGFQPAAARALVGNILHRAAQTQEKRP